MSARSRCFIALLAVTSFMLFSYLYANSFLHWQKFIFISNFFSVETKHWSECSDEACSPQKINITDPFSATVVQACGLLVDRIRLFNEALETIRAEKIHSQKPKNWTLLPANQMFLLAEWNEDFFQSLDNYTHIRTIILPWVSSSTNPSNENWSSMDDTSNIQIHAYYETTASDPLCTWIETPGQVCFAFDVINNWTCNRNMSLASVPKSLSVMDLNAKPPYAGYYFPKIYPKHFFTQTPTFVFSLYLIEYGIVDGRGDVYSESVKFVPYNCFPDRKINPLKNFQNIPKYKEIFVITQSYGEQVYHRMIEVIPRIALFVKFLQRNPTIKIHAPHNYGLTEGLLKILGFPKDRIVTGNCRGEIVYLPRASMCGFANIAEIQELSRLYRQYVDKHLAPIIRNKIIVINRSRYRGFTYQSDIERVVKLAATAYNLSFEVFRDNPAPSLNDTMRLFHSAVMVVGPHGAGLANIVFSQPGTYVIEGVCNLPYTILFYQRLTYALGHRWHGIPAKVGCRATGSTVGGRVDILPSVVNTTVVTYLEHMFRLNSINTSFNKT